MAEVGRLPFVRVALPVARSAVPRPQDEALSRRTALTLSGSRGCCRTREHLAENRGPAGEKDPLANEDPRNLPPVFSVHACRPSVQTASQTLYVGNSISP